MKLVIGEYTINLNEEVMKEMKKSSYVRKMTKSLGWTGIDPVFLEKKITEAYELINGAGK